MTNTLSAKDLWSLFCSGQNWAGRVLCDMAGGHAQSEWDGFEAGGDTFGMFCAAQFAAGELGAITVL